MVPNLGGIPQVVLIQPKMKIGKLKILRQNCRILLSSAKFSAARPLLPSCNFSATMGPTCSSYCLGAVPPPPLGRRQSILSGNRTADNATRLVLFSAVD